MYQYDAEKTRCISTNIHEIVLKFLVSKLNPTSRWRSFSKPSYFHQVGKDPLRYSTVGRMLEKAADKYDSHEAIVSRHQNRILTFEEALREADKLAAGLRKTGLNIGDRVGLWAPNLIEWYIGFMACARAGFVAVRDFN